MVAAINMKVLYLYIGSPDKDHRAFCDSEARKQNIKITTLALSKKWGVAGLLVSAFMAKIPAKKYDVIVTTEYFMAFAVSLRFFLLRKRVKHIVYGINQSAKLLVFKLSSINNFVNKIFNQADLFVTHSRAEMALFNKAHNIDINKFIFSHWGFDLPEVKKDIFSNRDKEYISFVGRNNRDLKTFCDAVGGMEINGVIIASIHDSPKFSVPDNIEIHYDLDMDACLSCLRHAKMNAVLVKDGNRGAGHITIVASMLMKKPQIISDVSVIKEYVVDGVHGVSVPLSDSQSVREAVQKLQDETFSQYCGEEAYLYASKYFINQTVSKRFIDVLITFMDGRKPDNCNREWLSEYQQITKK